MDNRETVSPSEDQPQNRETTHCEPGPWANCCSGMGNTDSNGRSDTDMQQAMGRCFSCCRYFLLFPVILGIGFLLLGWYLSPEAVRALWMVGAGLIACMGLFCAVAMRRFLARGAFSGCCEPWFGQKTQRRQTP